MLNFYILEYTSFDISIIIYFIREIYLIDDFTIKIFINIDIIVSKKIVINDGKQIAIIDSCDLIIKLHIIARDNRINCVVRLLKQITISSHFYITISIKFREQTLLTNRNYFFHSQENLRLRVEDNFFEHVIDAHLIVVQIRNFIN